MGWVEKTFADRVALGYGIPEFWNSMRDSIGTAVTEYNDRAGGGSNELFKRDCMAQGKYCVRLEKKSDGSSIEIFLDLDEQSLKITHGADHHAVCHYRLTELRAIEFYQESLEGDRILPTEEACKIALSSFILKPFPKTFINDGKFIKL